MFARMEPDSDDELISSIAPDVMKCLGRCDFFEKLDKLLSPEDNSIPAQGCDGTYKLSKSILLASGFDLRRHHRCTPIQGRILRL
jgi:hypothetical protein